MCVDCSFVLRYSYFFLLSVGRCVSLFAVVVVRRCVLFVVGCVIASVIDWCRCLLCVVFVVGCCLLSLLVAVCRLVVYCRCCLSVVYLRRVLLFVVFLGVRFVLLLFVNCRRLWCCSLFVARR